jgi:hypothetical protein
MQDSYVSVPKGALIHVFGLIDAAKGVSGG